MLIRYIGLKPSKTDNVAGTGLVWTQAAPVQSVLDQRAAAKLLQFKTVWVEDGQEPADAPVAPSGTLELLEQQAAADLKAAEEAKAKEAEEAAAAEKAKNDAEAEAAKALNGMTEIERARAEAAQLGLKVHHNTKLETVLKAIADHKAANPQA